MTTQVPPTSLLPLDPEQLARLQAATGDLSPLQMAWLSGYFWGQLNQTVPAGATIAPPPARSQAITLLSASQTGNARRLAEQLRDVLLAAQLDVTLVNAGDYKFKHIADKKILLVIASTQGEGDPPEEAMALYKFLFSKKAPRLENVQFAVFGLGDTSYEHFAKVGKDFDQRLAELGAQRLHDRVDADVEYQPLAEAWRRDIVALLKGIAARETPAAQQHALSGAVNQIDATPYTKEQPLTAALSVKQ